jgi:hypothetical protein
LGDVILDYNLPKVTVMKKFKHILFWVIFLSLFSSCQIITTIIRTKKWLPKSTPATEKYLDTIPFSVDYGWIMMDATIAGKKGVYILDSGAPTLLDYYDINREGIRSEPKKDIEPKASLRWALLTPSYVNKIEDVQIGSTKFSEVGANTVTFALFDVVTDCEKIQGLIGANVMSDGVWSVRYETNQVIFTNDISKLNISKKYSFKMIPFGLLKSPVIEIEINGVLYKALIDLGNSGKAAIINNKNHLELAVEPCNINKPTSLMGHPLAPKEIETVDVEFLKLKSNAFKNQIDFFAAQKSGIETKKPLEGLDIILGYDFLKNFNITLDWPNEMVYFEPIEEEFNKKKELKWPNFKIDFFNYDKKVYVMSVLPQYCDTTQISVGDTVVAINNIPIKDIVGDDYCAFVKGEKSLTPKNGEPIFITVKNKAGRITTLEQKEVVLFE